MSLTEPEIYLLITRHLSFNTSVEEDEWLAQWIQQSKENGQVFERLKAIWLSAGREQDHSAETAAAFAALKTQLREPAADTAATTIPETLLVKARPKRVKIISLALAACAAAACLLWGVFGWQSTPPQPDKVIVAAQKTTVTLGDGSTVCLAPGSSLRYPVVFGPAQRTVYLQGQAYFQVSKNPHQPFVVVSGQVYTEVLGTSFTVSAFANQEKISVALIEGKVRVHDSTGQQQLLQPGTAWQYNKRTRQSGVQPIGSSDNVTAWMSRQLIFNNISLSEAAVQLQAVYGVQLVFANRQAASNRIWGKFKNEPLEKVLETIRLAGIQYSMKGHDTVYISTKQP
jgi:ferric-dicitrate binding protein FerR (iron transport regulator)